MRALALIVTFVAACACPAPAAPTAPPPGTPPPVEPPPPTPPVEPPPAPQGGLQGMACVEGKCAEGLQCVTYYGIAGPSGPQFTSCEIPCPLAESTCPEGQACLTIADGPGRVCRPK